MRLRIFSCHHLDPARPLSTGLYHTLVSGLQVAPGSVAITDLSGDNISHMQRFSELRHQFYVWKNLLSDYDYVGFEHYRRPFCILPWSRDILGTRAPGLARLRRRLAQEPNLACCEVDPDTFEQFDALRAEPSDENDARVRHWVAGHDLIATYFLMGDIDAEFRTAHPDFIDLWAEVVAELQAYWAQRFPASLVRFPAPWSCFLNSYIMRAELFDQYMDLLFTVLLPMEARYPQAPARIWGFMTERLLGLFITHKMLEQPDFRSAVVPHMLIVRA